MRAAWRGAMRALGHGFRGASALAVRPPLNHRSIRLVVAITVVSAFWFGLGPDGVQMLGIRAATPALAALAAVGMWRLGADRRLPAASARFWLVLSLALLIFTAGMVVDFARIAWGIVLREAEWNAGETLLYPVAGLFAIVALVVYPTAARARIDRIKIGFDIAIVLFGCATFVWYFDGSRRLSAPYGWEEVSASLVFPALTLLAGFAVLRITLAGVNVIGRRTMYCFIFAATGAVTSIFLDVDPASWSGRFGSILQVFVLDAVVLGVALQRRVVPARLARATAEARPGWRRPFTVLPYGALIATVALLLAAIGRELDLRGWVVAGGVLLLTAAVMLRQLTSLWENTRLLSSNVELNAQLSHHAYHDHLTGLANRALFTDRVAEALTRPRGTPLGRGPETTVAVLFVDLDDFKVVNDSLGHHIGDELLVDVAEALRDTIRSDDMLCRLGGDEFAILLEDITPDEAVAVARSVVSRLRRPFRPSAIQVRIEASVGVAVAPLDADAPVTAVELLRNADVAMYSAKNAARKGGWRLFEPTMLTGLLHRHERRASLVRAVEAGEFDVYYQPIVNLATGEVIGAEALARWRPDGEDIVLPIDFIPLAEETGLIAEIDRHVLLKACHAAAGWMEGMPYGFALHVNLSARQLHRPEVVADVEAALRATGLPARSLTLEIAEGGLAHDPEAAAERLRGLTRLGVHIAIDDFGAGHSSLANLRAIPADTLKVDKSFTAELLDETIATPLAQAVIVLAATLGMHTVAEGIEHPEQARRLLDLGCTRGQGYHFGRPMTVEAFGEALTDRGLTRV